MKKMNLFGSNAEIQVLSDNEIIALRNEILTELTISLVENMPSNSIIIKGGFLLERLAPMARKTVDVDFSLDDISHYVEMKEIMNRVGEKMCARHQMLSFKVLDEIIDTADKKLSGGMTFTEVATNKTIASLDVSADKGIHEVKVYDFDDIGTVNGFSIESIIADKVRVLFSQKRFRRTKDLYDLYLLTAVAEGVRPIDLEKVRYIMRKANAVNNDCYDLVSMDMYPFTSERLAGYEHAWSKFKVVTVSNDVSKPELLKVVQTVAKFLDALLMVNNITGEFAKEW